MKYLISISFMIPFILLSCRQPAKNDAPKPETPKALQEKSGSAEIFSKSRGYDNDLVESLYTELTEKEPQLQKLEELISELSDQKGDSVKPFNTFTQKNTQYYQSGDQHLSQIQDSVLRQKIRTILDNSLSAYSSKVQYHKNLIDILDSKETTLSDMHTA